MQFKYLCTIILIMHFFLAFQIKGQKQLEDTVVINHSQHNCENVHFKHIQPYIIQIKPQELNEDKSFQKKLIIEKKVNLSYNLKYFDIQTNKSFSLILPKYPGLGDYHNYGGSLGCFNITNLLSLDYGAFISAQYGYRFSTKQIIFGNNFLLCYGITDKLRFRTWGQFVTPGRGSDPTFQIHNFFPTTNIGTGLQYDSQDKTKIQFGVDYQYDPSEKCWRPESSGKVFFNF